MKPFYDAIDRGAITDREDRFEFGTPSRPLKIDGLEDGIAFQLDDF